MTDPTPEDVERAVIAYRHEHCRFGNEWLARLMMEGPKFKGYNRSALDRARRELERHRAAKGGE